MKYLLIPAVVCALLTGCVSKSGNRIAQHKISRADSIRLRDSTIKEAIHLIARTDPEHYMVNRTQTDQDKVSQRYHTTLLEDETLYSIGEVTGFQAVNTSNNDIAVAIMTQLDQEHIHYDTGKDTDGMWDIWWSDKVFVPYVSMEIYDAQVTVPSEGKIVE